MSNRVASSSGSDSDSSSDDGRYNRLKSTVRRTSGSERKKHLSGSEEEGQYTGSDSEGEQKPKDARDNPVKDIRSDERFNKSRSKSPDQDETRREEKEDKTRDRHNRDRRPRNRRDEYNNRRNDERANRRYENSGGRDLSRRSPVDDGDRSRRDRRGDGDRRRNNRDGDRSLNESNGDRERSRRDRDDDEGRARNKENNDERAEQKRRRDDNEQGGNNEISKDANGSVPKRAKKEDLLTTKTGGAYIPPARLRMMQESITDKSSEAYQRISWEALKKSINGLVNKVNVSNIANIVRELFGENLVRGRGLIARSIIQAQAASHTFTHVYAALVAIINTKFPQNGELIMKRLIIQFKRGYKRNDKTICSSATKFLAHLVNQQVAHEVIALEILTLLLENPSDDSVEIAVGFLKECGQKLTDVSPRGIHAIFERLRNILHEAAIDKRVQYMIEVMFAVRKDGFKDHVSVLDELDLVEEDEQFTHLLTLEDVTDTEDMLNVFRADPEFLENEEKYKEIKKGILDSDSSDDGESGSGSGSDSDSDEEAEDEEAKQVIIDSTETNLVALRRTIYLTIQSSLDFEECAHKLMKMELKPGQEAEVCNMILDCCAQQRTFEKFYALLGQRFCQIDKKFVGPYEQIFQEQYDTIHRLETAKLRNVAKFFAHLLHTDAISWGVIQCMKMNEEDTTSSSRIFVKILFQELSEFMGLPKLNTRLKDVTLAPFFEGLFPRDNPRNTRFAINFFTSIGLGGLTDELRDHLKNMPKKAPVVPESDSSSSDSDSSSDDSSSSSDSDSSSDSEPTPKKSKKKEQRQKKTNSDSKKSKKKPSKTHEESDSDSETEKVEKESRRRKGQEKQGQEKHITSRRGKENLRYDEPESDRTSRKNSAKKRRDKIPDEGSESDERSGRRREKKESVEDNERYSKRRDDRHEGRSKPSNNDEKYAKRNERPGREKYSDGVSHSSKHRR